MSESTSQSTAGAGAGQRARLDVIDAWRGLVVALMALDHVKDFLGLWSMPEAPGFRASYPSFVAWLTRYVTHSCAPSFVFLAGTSAVLFAASRRARGLGEVLISGHLLLRGALLVAIEFTVVAWGWNNSVGVFQVIACLGVLLGLGAVLRFVPGPLAWGLGFALAFAHPLLADRDLIPALQDLPRWWRAILLQPGFGTRPSVMYPVIPWLAAFLMGIGFGKALLRWPARAMRNLLVTGLVFLGLWLALRLTGGFTSLVESLTGGEVKRVGNLTPTRPGRGYQSFMAMSKYPPAADFLFWTLGGMFVVAWALSVTQAASSRALSVLRTFGRAPLFFYCAHLYLYRWLASHEVFHGGYAGVYVAWLIGLGLLILPCWAFGRLKQRYRVFPLDLL